MASSNKGGRRESKLQRIQFTFEGERKSLRLGKIPVALKEEIQRHVKKLAVSKEYGTPLESSTAGWLKDIGDDLRAKLVKVGLIEGTKKKVIPTLAQFIDDYAQSRPDVKDTTLERYVTTKGHLVGHFGSEIKIDEITPGDADTFFAAMKAKYAVNTAKRTVSRSRQFFRYAKRCKLIAENPFDGIKGLAVKGNAKRFYYVTDADIAAVIDASPNAQWRCLWALARYAGLRVPSEVSVLRWTDINWETGMMHVTCEKLSRFDEHAYRDIPIFEAVRPFIEELWESAPVGAVHVIEGVPWANPGVQARRIMDKAGVNWVKPFQNCRASLATELKNYFPDYVVHRWLGHSEKISEEHYDHVQPEHIKLAQNRGAKSGSPVVQKRAQYLSRRIGKEKQETTQPHTMYGVVPNLADPYGTIQMSTVPPLGLEPKTL